MFRKAHCHYTCSKISNKLAIYWQGQLSTQLSTTKMWLLVGIWGSCFLWKRKQRNNTCGWQLKLSQKKTLLITETQLRPPATVVSSLLHPLMLDQIKMRPYYVPQQLLFLSCFIHLCYIRWKWDSTSPSNWCFFHIHIHQIRGKWDSTTCMSPRNCCIFHKVQWKGDSTLPTRTSGIN